MADGMDEADPVDDARDEERDQDRHEILAVATLVAALAAVLQGYLTSAALWRISTFDGVDGPSGWELVETAAAGGAAPSFAVIASAPALVVLTYLIIVLGPGRWISPLGTRTLGALRIVAAVIVADAVIATVAVARHGSRLDVYLPLRPDGRQDQDLVVTILDRTAAALPFVAVAAVVAGTAWLAHRTLEDLPDVGATKDLEGD